LVNVAFIVGSPRSGTTLLGEIIDRHPSICNWYEPFFVLDHYFRDNPDDVRDETDATSTVVNYIRREYSYFQKKQGCALVVDKTPNNSFKLPFLHTIFPEAKFIHMLRDGRDATLSIKREWDKRVGILKKSGNYLESFASLKRFMDRQPILRHKLNAIYFEIGAPANLLHGNLRASHRARRWRGRPGWGPQFKGWSEVIETVTPLAFNAMQWAGCVESVLADSSRLSALPFLEVRYENLLKDPENELCRLYEFLEVPIPSTIMADLPPLLRDNTAKWRTKFTPDQKQQIGPILNPLLLRLGYAQDSSWYSEN
jgi:hypothetical protein